MKTTKVLSLLATTLMTACSHKAVEERQPASAPGACVITHSAGGPRNPGTAFVPQTDANVHGGSPTVTERRISIMRAPTGQTFFTPTPNECAAIGATQVDFAGFVSGPLPGCTILPSSTKLDDRASDNNIPVAKMTDTTNKMSFWSTTPDACLRERYVKASDYVGYLP